ncbi:MAG: energy transducer TonB [Pararhodobacter sp.]|nr:energy transducer TonB [Pararhodobacter sp.]
MDRGIKISLGMHAGLILAVILADSLTVPRPDRRPEVTEVALISTADFAALVEPRREQPAPSPEAPAAPEPETPPPPPPAAEDAPEPPPPPTQADEGTSDRPQAAVVDEAPPPPDASLRPVQRQAERVAPEAVPEPDPEVQTDRRDQAALVPDDAPADTPEEAAPEQEATAREAAATETVTEATDISETEAPRRTATAPEVSMRPVRRPERPPTPPVTETARAEPQPERPATQTRPEPEPAPEPDGPSASAIEDALLAALDSPDDAPAPSPRNANTRSGDLSQSDIDMLRLAVEDCWNVGRLSSEAMQVVVTIGFELTRDARPVAESIQLVEASGGSQPAQRAAFDVGRAAINECGRNGFGLPSEYYDQWKEVEITFNPARMSVR